MFFQDVASPFDSVRQMNILQERLNRLASSIQDIEKSEFPPINIWVSEKGVVVVAEVPGIDAANLDLQVCNQILTLKTKREPEEPADGQTFHRRERGYGQFTRSIELPYAVDQEKISAFLSNGILKVELSRAAADSPKKITVEAS